MPDADDFDVEDLRRMLRGEAPPQERRPASVDPGAPAPSAKAVSRRKGTAAKGKPKPARKPARGR